jgi:hypothetical protein
MGGEVFLTRQEVARQDSIVEFESAQRLVLEFWEETLLALEESGVGGPGLTVDEERTF